MDTASSGSPPVGPWGEAPLEPPVAPVPVSLSALSGRLGGGVPSMVAALSGVPEPEAPDRCKRSKLGHRVEASSLASLQMPRSSRGAGDAAKGAGEARRSASKSARPVGRPPGSSPPAAAAADRGGDGPALPRSRSVPVPSEKRRDSEKAAVGSTLRKGRSLIQAIAAGLPKATAAAAAGSGTVAAKVRKAVAAKVRKMVLPFSYGVDDPRIHHVQAAEMPLCPEFLPSAICD